MQGFKGLIPKQLLVDEAFQPIIKRAEDQRKATQLCIDFFQLISKFFESYSGNLTKTLGEFDNQDTQIVYYKISCLMLQNIGRETSNLTQNTKGSFKELTSLCNTIFLDFSKTVLSFQTSMRKYQEFEQIVGQLSKKYYRTHKTMLASIEAYKSSFSDVNLIYNRDEKIKRYNLCEKTFKSIEEEYESITQRVEGLTQKKVDIIKYYNDLPDEFVKVTKVIGSKIISETKNFVGYFCSSHKIIITYLADQKFALEKERIPTFFGSIEDHSKPEYFTTPNLKSNIYIPLFLEHHQLLKDQFLENYNSQLLIYLKEVEIKVDRRRQILRRLSDFYSSYIKLIEKVYLVGVKEILIFFEKMKKKLGEVFGNRLVSFLKSVNSFFELSAGVNEKLIKSSSVKLQALQTYVNEESKLLKLFGDELKNNIEKFIGKKELKKIKEDQFTEEQNVVNYRIFRKEISQQSDFIKHLVSGFNEKMEKNCEKMRNIFWDIVSQINLTINEFFSLCLEYQEVYFGEDQFQSNFKKYQLDIDKVLEKDKTFFQELAFNSLKNDNGKITFEGDFSKVLDFKKIKKPYKTQQGSAMASSPNFIEQPGKLAEIHGQNSLTDVEKSGKKQEAVQQKSINLASRQTLTKDEKQLKNIDFLMEKIKFKENEQLIKSFSCAYAEKIVLQGRIYITNQRVCFSSNFNSANLFFGGTFIQVPKEDIKKIEKKKNALFIDNTLSFTTVNGQIAFTSFFSRDEAYDLICKTFAFNFEDEIYEFQKVQQEPEIPDFLVELEEEDDIQDAELEPRKDQIQKLIPTFPYIESVAFEMQKQGFNALKIFKLFYSDAQIVINKRKHPNFLAYIKNLIKHTDLDTDPWDIELDKIFNKANLKSKAPIRTSRKVRATVPVSAAGVPFMPKTAKSQQTQVLHFFSKHRFMILADVSTSGAPYTDTFTVKVKTQVVSDQSGKCKITWSFFVNFIKATMMKSMIQSKSQEETGAASKAWMNEIQQYFVNLQKMKSKKKVGENNNPLQELEEEMEIKNKDIEELNKEKEKLVEKIEELEKKLKIRDYTLIGALALVIILILFALS